MKTLSILGCAFAGLMLSLAGAQALPVNLVVNPGFELGNTGFTSGYTYQTNLVPPGTYYVDGQSQPHNAFWPTNVTPHAGQEYMIINGANVSGVPVWSETGLVVVPNTTYFFSTWITSLFNQSPAVLSFSINGTQLGSNFSPTLTVGNWQLFSSSWNSLGATTADISIINQNTAFNGNDFGLDDISLSVTNPVPEPITLSVFGAGLVGLAIARRRRKAQAA